MNEKNKKTNGNDTESKLERFRFFVGLMQRYFTGQASEKENQIIDGWDAQSAWEKHREKVDNRKMDTACDGVWDKIIVQLEFEQKYKTFQLHTYFQRYAVAAVIFILFGGGILFYTQQSITGHNTETIAQTRTLFQTTNDQIRLVILPDGSRIQMNRGTKFCYATHAFNRKQREVWLEGEAFFEVAKNKEKPFIIHTGTMQTTVRGTSFNIKAYPQLAENVVSVRSGKVEVANTNRKIIATLTKNKQLIYHGATNHFQTNDMDWENAAGWTDGKLVLCNANVKELQFRIKQNFNADLTIEGSLLEGAMFNSSFNKGTGLKNILERICTLYNVRYEVSGNKIRIHS